MRLVKNAHVIEDRYVRVEDGTPVPLPDAVITELEFDDNGEAAVMRGRALCWTA